MAVVSSIQAFRHGGCPEPVEITLAKSSRAGSVTSSNANAIIGVLVLIGTEIMFFGGFITAFIVLRAGAMWWPPPGQTRLPVGVTGVNSLVLLASGWTMYRALCAVRRDNRQALIRWAAATAILGAIFFSVQGFEWVRLVHYGLNASSSLYGALFYTIVGAHALHVLGGLIALLTVIARAANNRYDDRNYGAVEGCWAFWTFVVALWAVIYVLVYLS